MIPRKPLAPAESLVPRSVRLTPTMWERIDEQARLRGFDESLPFVRKLIEYALEDAERQARMEASVGVRRQVLAGSQRTARF